MDPETKESNPAVGLKRSAESDDERSPKRHRCNYRRPKRGNDQTFGQRGLFGDLEAATVPTDEDLDFEDESDALEYLRSVRQEAGAIPHLLVAVKAGPLLPVIANGNGEEVVDRGIYQDGRGDFRGYYKDGAYISYPKGYSEEDIDEDNDKIGEEDVEQDAQEDGSSNFYSEGTSENRPHNSNSAEIYEAYYSSLFNHYLSLRKILQSEPPKSAVASLPPENTPEIGNFGPGSQTFTEWAGRLRNTDPLPAQVASMHKNGVIRLIRILLGDKFFRKHYVLRERTSRWIWSLLARLPEKGELDYQQIGWVRELGKRAVLFMVSMAEAEALHDHYGVGGSGDSEHEAEVEVEPDLYEELSQHSSSEDALDEDEQITQDAAQKSPPTQDPNHDAPSDQEAAQEGVNSEQHTNSNTQAVDDKSMNNGITSIPEQDALKEDSEHGLNTGIDSEVLETEAKPARTPEPSDVEMQDDSELDEGEIVDTSLDAPQEQSAADMESIKARLLAQLEKVSDDEALAEDTPEFAASPDLAAGKATAEQDEAMRAKINVRATLNMILTVAGEFYGQRDLLEFRDPFGGLCSEDK